MSVRDWKGTAKMTVKKLGEIIGTTGDTGGTATAGSLMAKVNEIIGKAAKEKTAKEILEKVGNGSDVHGEILLSSGKIVSATTKTVLDITGRGKFIGAYIYDAIKETSATNLTIIIDGGVVLNLDVKHTNTGSDYGNCILCCANQHRKYNVTNLSTVENDFFGKIAGASITEYKKSWVVPLSPYAQTITGIIHTFGFSFFNNYLQFKESLKVTATTRGTAGEYLVAYMLDE